MPPTAGTRLRFKNAQSKKTLQKKRLPSLKNRIRGLERFLSRGGLSDAGRRMKKMELQQLKEELEKKDHIAVEKKTVEQYKKPRFFERVKVMRKLRQAKNRMKQANDEAERAQYEKEFKMCQEEMMYIYYYPKNEPYIPLFVAARHSDEKQKRQKELRDEAIARFEKEKHMDSFCQFCYNDDESNHYSAASETRSVAELLLKNPTKEMVKKQKKVHSKRGKSREKIKPVPALVDQEEDKDMLDAVKKDCAKEEEHEEENDDFFL